MANGKMKVKLNKRGVRSILQSQEMMQICKDHAYSAKSKLGDGYEVTYRKGKTRVNASIAAMSDRAKKENAKGNTILKALGGS